MCVGEGGRAQRNTAHGEGRRGEGVVGGWKHLLDLARHAVDGRVERAVGQLLAAEVLDRVEGGGRDEEEEREHQARGDAVGEVVLHTLEDLAREADRDDDRREARLRHGRGRGGTPR